MYLANFIKRVFESICLCVKLVLIRNVEIRDKIKLFRVSTDTRIRVGNSGKIIMGCISTEANVHLTAWGGILNIGKNCSFNRNDIVVCRDNIRIGNGTIMGPNVCIYDHDHVFGSKGKVDGEYNASSIIIGNNVWIGAGVIILRGTTIGDNCVIGAGSIIHGDIPANSLVTSQSREFTVAPLHD